MVEPISTSLVRMDGFGPFHALVLHAHQLYMGGFSEHAVLACREGLLVTAGAGDRASTQFLRYVEGMAARMPQGEVRDMPAGMAVRSRQVVAATGESQRPGTRLDYHWPLPSQPLKWALASFTTMGAATPEEDVTELFVGLFDAIMLTWRWRPGLII